MAVALLVALGARPASAQTAPGYVPCLGCIEHHEMQVRWHRPFVLELAGEGAMMFDHYRLEAQARDLGLCESDVLTRNPVATGGCHAFSATRAWLIETPIEVALFTSPAWGLQRRGHPRWAMALELVPFAYHALSVRATTEAIHQYQRQSFLFH
ncbi:MAG TPA: hypothetical protein VN709_04290 [Terriglobales bacterium]|nr:hypothetical protein [Terriglobales bacterium]